MCFAPEMPKMQKSPMPPSARDGVLEGLGKRRAAVAQSSSNSTNPTGAQGVVAPAPTYKQTLGG